MMKKLQFSAKTPNPWNMRVKQFCFICLPSKIIVDFVSLWTCLIVVKSTHCMSGCQADSLLFAEAISTQ